MSGVDLVLLGGARLDGPTPIARLDKRTAAILALLAVDGPQPRSRVAGLLWPESSERTARNNLAQALRRLRTAAGSAVVKGEQVLELGEVRCDVTELFGALVAGAPAPHVASHALIGGYELDDLPELEAWLREARARVARAWAERAVLRSERCEQEGELDEAIAWAEAAVAADPIAERGHLRIVRLLLVRGDAPAAMRAYERCKVTLARELGISPSAAMLDALRAIRASIQKPRAKAPGDSMPALVLRPPRVGRQTEWEILAKEHAHRRGVIVRGDAGLGKTRLVRDYFGTLRDVALVEGRPGDAGVVLASIGRTIRTLWPALGPAMPAWVCRQLGPLLPAPHGGDAVSEGHQLLLFDAVAFVLSHAAEAGSSGLFVDDLQWLDEASAEVCRWLLEQCWRGELARFAVVAHRLGELPSDSRQWLDRCAEAGLATTLELAPLSAEDTRRLVDALEIPGLVARGADLARASGGVPLFLLELVRGALTQEDLPQESFALTSRVKALVRLRLERLSHGALRLARVAAVAGTELTLELAASVLETPAIDLAEAWSELERAHMLSGVSFTHDVLAEAVREALPPLVRAHVHGRVAAWLLAQPTAPDPGRVAAHLLAAGRERDALPFLHAAAEQAFALSALSAMVRALERAAAIHEALGEPSAAFDALWSRTRCLLGSDAARIVAWLSRLAKSPEQKAMLGFVVADQQLTRGAFAEAEAGALVVERRARKLRAHRLEAATAQLVFVTQLHQGALDRAEASLQRVEALAPRVDDEWIRIGAIYFRGELLSARGAHAEALIAYTAAVAALDAWGKLGLLRARGLAAIATAHVALGDLDAAEQALAQVDPRGLGDPLLRVSVAADRLARTRVALARGDAQGALRWLEGVVNDATPFVYVAAARGLIEQAHALTGAT